MEVTRMFDLLDNYKEKYGNKDDVLAGKEDGKWIKYNINEYIEKSDLFSTGLLAMGLKKAIKLYLSSTTVLSGTLLTWEPAKWG